MASGDDTKAFTYKEGVISYEASALGVTATINLEKTSDTITHKIEESTSSPESTEAETSTQTAYKMGETWTVDGQWELTVTSVEETSDRNEYADKEPAAVYNVKFTYKNVGYTDDLGMMDGLYFVLDDTIIDAQGTMGYSYPGDITDYAQETPIGASCKGEVCIGVDNPGSFKIIVTQYDGNSEKQSATFEIDV